MGDSIIVVFGGSSGERRVSVASAQHIASVMTEIEAWFVSPDGAVFACPLDVLKEHSRAFETDLLVPGKPRFGSLTEALDHGNARASTFVLALHGGAGEDGTVQREFETRGIAFTGSGSLASERAFDKTRAKQIANDNDVRTAASRMFVNLAEVEIERELLGFFCKSGRLVAKPIADGSSVGLYHVRTEEDVAPTAKSIAASGLGYLAEEFIDGVELTVGVVDMGKGAGALCASEVRLDPGRAFDYEGKYLGRGTIEVTPAEVPEAVSSTAQRIALTMHHALGCEGYSRTDVIAGKSGVIFLETNTLPGLTRASFLPQQLAVDKTTMRQFLDEQITLARRRAAR